MRRHLEPARRQRDRLAMIAARGRDQSRQTLPVTKDLCRIDDRCARLERPNGVWFSCLTHTSPPKRSHSKGQTNCAVGGITSYTNCCACLISSIVGKLVS